MTANADISYDATSQTLVCHGDWRIANIAELQRAFNQITIPPSGQLTFIGNSVSYLDTAGAWLIIQLCEKFERLGINISLDMFSDNHQSLINLVKQDLKRETPLPAPRKETWIVRLGHNTMNALYELTAYLSFIGYLSLEFLRICCHPRSFRLGAVFSTIYRSGCLALPIIALLSFMIGVVITFQMGLQLKNYGANVFIVDLLGLSILREFAPLLTAIMVAGRSGSAFTAQLGIMKINQEIDALNTMGVTPAELLILPRIIGLLIALPLLTVWADIFGVFGGMIMANNMLSITFYDFMHRFPDVIPLRALLIGVGKTPIFALIIASIGCFEGMKVKQDADSVGTNTTRSVVLGIFFIIVADAIFSVIFSKLKL